MQTYRLRLLTGEEIVSEEFFSETSIEKARLTARMRVLALREAVKHDFTHELIPVESDH